MGSPHLQSFLEKHKGSLAADVCISTSGAPLTPPMQALKGASQGGSKDEGKKSIGGGAAGGGTGGGAGEEGGVVVLAEGEKAEGEEAGGDRWDRMMGAAWKAAFGRFRLLPPSVDW